MIIKTGPHNTESVLEAVKAKLETQPLEYATIASRTGEVGLKAVESLIDHIPNLIVVGRSHGYGEPNQPEFSQGYIDKIESLGAKVLIGPMIFSLINDSYRNQGMPLSTDIIKEALEKIGVGVTIAVDNVMRACDAGLIPHRKDVFGLAGNYEWEGLDTAVVIKSANSRRFLDLKVREILYKPMHW